MSKLDINELLNKSLARKSEEAITESNLNLNLEEANQDPDCPGCPKADGQLNLNLEAVAHQELVESYIGEDVIMNIRSAIGAGLGVKTVLEARHAA
jgi:hypothetical protein